MTVCSVVGCDREVGNKGARGWCHGHYEFFRRTGRAPTKPILTTLADRLWAKTDRSGGPDSCWQWLGAMYPSGYGCIGVAGKIAPAHRVAYELTVEPIADGLEIDHLCRNRACVNPAHLEPVTKYENMRRGESPQAQNMRKTHCVNGHPLSGDNLMVRSRGAGRDCRICHRERSREAQRRYRARRKAAG